MNSELSQHICFPEPKLLFHPERLQDTDVHPLRGLVRHGPFSKNLVPAPIRIATLAPAGESNLLYEFIRQLKQSHVPKERVDYLPEWPGFQAVFHVTMGAADSNCRIGFDT